MKYFVFENFSLRLLSVVVAVIGWFYVNIIVNPVVERQFEVELALTDKRGDCVYKNVTQKVNIFMRGGRREIIENYYPVKSKLLATANVSKAASDSVNKIPVNVVLPRGLELVKTEPREIEVTPVLIEQHTVEVNVILQGTVKQGYYVKSYGAYPETAIIKGPQKLIGGIKQILAPVNVANLDAGVTMKQLLTIVELAGTGDNADVTIAPKEAEIRVEIQPLPSRQVNIVARISGKVARGYKIASIVCDPQAILIKGPLKVIDGVNEILTEAVDVSNIKSGLVQNVNLHIAADCAYVVENKPVSIIITLQPVYKNQKFSRVKINPPLIGDGYEVVLEKDFIDIVANAPVNIIEEIDTSSISLESKVIDGGGFETGSVTLELFIKDESVPIEIKPSQIKAYIKTK
jgi:YbbR domain-containing protein